MKYSALGSVVVVALFVGSVGCGGGAASHDGGGGKGGNDGGARGGNGGSSGGGGGTGGGASAGTGGGGSTGGTGAAAGRGGTTGTAGTTGSAGASGAAGTGGAIGGTIGGAGTTGTAGRGGTTGTAGTTGSAGAGGATAGTGGGAAGTTGSGGSGATCNGAAPCGGNVVGTWNFVSICLNGAAFTDAFTTSSCPEATISNATGTETGSIAFTATEYAVAASIAFSYTLTLPADCTNGFTCEYFGDMLYGSPNVQSASCTGTTTCVCPIVTRPTLSSESGTYTTSGSTINVLPTSGGYDSASYCVENNRLHILDVETITDMGVMTMRTRTDQVAQRQQ